MFVRGVSLQGPLLVLGRGCALVFETNDKASSGEAHAQLLIQKLY